MKNLFKIVTVFALLLNVAFAQEKWAVDPAHTNTRFSVSHLGIAFIDGEFTSLEGGVETKSANSFDAAVVNFSIAVNSIDTRVEARDNHLKSDDFFNAEKYPSMTFKNAVMKKAKDGKYTLTGDFTIRDVTKKVVFEVVQNNGIITDPWGMTRAGFTAKATINRFDYNIKYNDLLPTGVPAVAPNIDVVVNVEVVKQ